MSERYNRFLDALRRQQLDGFLIMRPSNLTYLYGFTGSLGFAWCLRGESTLLVDSRYLQQARSETRHCRIQLATDSLQDALKERMADALGSPASVAAIGFESDFVSHDLASLLESWDLPCRWTPSRDLVARLRMVKEPGEVRALRAAFRRAHSAFRTLRPQLAFGMSEMEIAGRLELALRLQEGQGTAFETIVAAGPRSALPHSRPTNQRWSEGEPLLIDFGIRYGGYTSDLTRMLEADGDDVREIVSIVEEARRLAFDVIRPGVEARQVDAAARGWIEERGYGNCFGHGVGHGIGLDVHELPRISKTSDTVLEAGMTFTVEPGIYLPGQFGVRLEDAVVVTQDGFEFLSDCDRL